MTGRPPLWLPHEEAYTPEPPPPDPDPDEQAFTDLHGDQPRACRTTVTVGAIDNYEPGEST